jgi:hypothetical protein
MLIFATALLNVMLKHQKENNFSDIDIKAMWLILFNQAAEKLGVEIRISELVINEEKLKSYTDRKGVVL